MCKLSKVQGNVIFKVRLNEIILIRLITLAIEIHVLSFHATENEKGDVISKKGET